jgi:hypothetical protein
MTAAEFGLKKAACPTKTYLPARRLRVAITAGDSETGND